MVRYLIRKGANVNAESGAGRTALLEACNRVNVTIAKVWPCQRLGESPSPPGHSRCLLLLR